MKKIILTIVILLVILLVPVIKQPVCFGAIGPENPTSGCASNRVPLLLVIMQKFNPNL